MANPSLAPFRNEPFTDFSTPRTSAPCAGPRPRPRRARPHYDLIIGGSDLQTPKTFKSVNPAQPLPNHRHPLRCRPPSKPKPPSRPRTRLRHLALHSRRRPRRPPRPRRRPHPPAPLRLLRLARLEVGKNWAEADADVGETIDFLEFYAREALRLAAATTPIQYPGERNHLRYIPLGVGAVIPPGTSPSPSWPA